MPTSASRYFWRKFSSSAGISLASFSRRWCRPSTPCAKQASFSISSFAAFSRASAHRQRIPQPGRRHDAWAGRRVVALAREIHLFSGLHRRGCGHHRRGRRLPRSVHLRITGRMGNAAHPRFFERHGGAELHDAGRARPYCFAARRGKADTRRQEKGKSRFCCGLSLNRAP